ncbi:MAG: colanic acid biosynthesis glycosyl transferase, partial [Candidatus Entotheonella gemina]
MARKVAYLMSRFPKISEIFILYEMLALKRLGLQIEVFPLIREHEAVSHPEAQAIVERMHWHPPYSRAVFAAQLYWIRRSPLAYLRAWGRAIRGNISVPAFLLRALLIVPQAALYARRMQALDIDHMHAHWATHPTLAAYVIHLLTDIPYSFTAHAHDIYAERPMLETKLRHAAFAVTISEYNRQFLQRLYGSVAADKTVVIHCGIDPDVFQSRAPAGHHDRLTLLCVGRLEAQKGHPYLIDACAKLKRTGMRFCCQLVGEGKDRHRIEARIEQLGLEADIILLGQQPRLRVHELLDQTDIVILPSVTTPNGRQEGIPVALMEALAMGKPCISTAISGIPELIEDGRTGLLVPERNAQALADAVQRLHDAPAWGQQLALAGREKVLR